MAAPRASVYDRHVRFAVLAVVALAACEPIYHGGGAPPVAAPEAQSTPAEHARRAEAVEGGVEELLGVVAEPQSVARTRAALAAARAGTANHERDVVDEIDRLVAIWGDIRAPGALQRLGNTFVQRGIDLMDQELPAFRDAADTFSDHALLGARVAMFVFRYPSEMSFAGGFTIDSTGPGKASGTIVLKQPTQGPKDEAFLAEARRRMKRAVALEPKDDRVWLLAGRMCRIEHEPQVDASCEPLLARCVEMPSCKQEHDFVARELRPRGCGQFGIDPTIELRGADEATSGVPFGGKNYKVDAEVFLEPKDVQRVVETSFARTFTLPSNTGRAGYEWDPVVRLNLSMPAAGRAGKAYAALAKRKATILLLKGGVPVGAMPAIGPWDGDSFPFFQVQNVPIERICVHPDV